MNDLSQNISSDAFDTPELGTILLCLRGEKGSSETNYFGLVCAHSTTGLLGSHLTHELEFALSADFPQALFHWLLSFLNFKMGGLTPHRFPLGMKEVTCGEVSNDGDGTIPDLSAE